MIHASHTGPVACPETAARIEAEAAALDARAAEAREIATSRIAIVNSDSNLWAWGACPAHLSKPGDMCGCDSVESGVTVAESYDPADDAGFLRWSRLGRIDAAAVVPAPPGAAMASISLANGASVIKICVSHRNGHVLAKRTMGLGHEYVVWRIEANGYDGSFDAFNGRYFPYTDEGFTQANDAYLSRIRSL